ncbi:LysR family transcriptional regulator [Cupriavidus sp. YR651]|uniref:helix-turn-helix domain-containing protein n=1 Tax=Cupriavidus sp. YR651 TaxID=1855315 RepID=UPI002101A3B4|nr:LysR family transcriptional regulator [Cupriavidus sp. YR651]
MRTFARVVIDGGFAPAARKLDLTTGQISRAISYLESRPGRRLLQRTTRRVALTEAVGLEAARGPWRLSSPNSVVHSTGTPSIDPIGCPVHCRSSALNRGTGRPRAHSAELMLDNNQPVVYYHFNCSSPPATCQDLPTPKSVTAS